MKNTLVGIVALSAVVIGAAAGLALWQRQAAMEQPNIVLVIGCTVRKDQMSMYGGHAEVTPFLQQIADQGVRFEDGITAAPWTKAASVALYTGHHAVELGMVEPVKKSNHRRLADEVTTLAEYLHDDGYNTIGLTANPNTNSIFGFGQGFDAYVEGSEFSETPFKIQGTEMVAEVSRLLDGREPEKPLFLQLMLVDAHSPKNVAPREAANWVFGDPITKPVAKYRAMLNRLDQSIAMLDVELQSRGLNKDNTVFVFVNDHGEGLKWPVHHGNGHGSFLYPSTTGMPLLVRGPGVPENRSVDGLVSQVDVVPTVMGIAGVQGYQGPGLDMSGAVFGRDRRTERTEAYVDTWYGWARRSARYTDDEYCQGDFLPQEVRDQARRDVRVLPTGCYDRASNPMAHGEPGAGEGLPALRAWRAQAVKSYETYPHTADAQIEDDLKERLEALGYVQ